MPELFSLAGPDLAAFAFFVAVWIFHSLAADGKLFRQISLTTAMNRQRDQWMHTMAKRDLRMIDTGIMSGLQQGTAFFASTSIFAIGGCFALLNGSDRVMMVLTDLPLATVPERQVFEAKVLGLIVLLAYSFFKFGWAYRLFNYCSILIGAVPVRNDAAFDEAATEAAVRRAARMNVLAGKHFNAGLRGIFFSIAYLGWFVGPAVLAVSSLLVLTVLLRRQFFSHARKLLIEDESGAG
jgi:uncharacterized membrane protein